MRSTTDRVLVAAALLALLTGAGACGDGEEKASGSGGAPCVLDAGPDADPCDADGDGFRALACGGDDCDDSRKDIHPGATDVCDGDVFGRERGFFLTGGAALVSCHLHRAALPGGVDPGELRAWVVDLVGRLRRAAAASR